MRLKLTAQFVESLKAPEAGQIDYWDQHTRGMGLRISQGGRKAWTVLYRFHGRSRRLTLGTFPTLSLADARQAAGNALREAQHGTDPATAKQDARSADTFGELAQLYLDRYAKREKRTWREDERKLKIDLLPKWRNRKGHEIKRADVLEMLDGIVDRGSPVSANRTRALISKVFNFGIKRGIVESNPAQGVDNPGHEQQRDRVLSEDEIRTLWGALDTEPAWSAAVFRLDLLTAQRRSEILGMTWDELDLASGWWTIPGERTKNGLAHRVPLAPQAVKILKTLQSGKHDEVFVFRGGRRGRPMANLQKPLRRLKKDTQLDFRFHDLRRTTASCMTGIGIPRVVVSKILNHVERGITAVYDRHSYDAEKRAAMHKWERRLQVIIANRQVDSNNKVISLKA
jgi:integrase